MERSQVLLRPLLSEKTTALKDSNNRFAFLVHVKANKIEVKEAVESFFASNGVKVDSVNIVRYHLRPKKKFGRNVGRISGYKKAYVTLKGDGKIDLFEGV